MESFGPQIVKMIEIIWVNIILSGDNAVVIAMACRGLPAHQRRMGMVMGAGVAIVLRIVFTVIVATLLTTPFLKIGGGMLLLWVAVKLIAEENDEAHDSIGNSDRLWHAVRTVAIADAVMSLDNVLAIAAVAKDSTALLVLGLVISIPLIVAGATLIMSLLARFPVLVWAGAGLLGWIAGEMLVSDPWLEEQIGVARAHTLEVWFAVAGAVLVLAAGYGLVRGRKRGAASV